MSEDKNNPNYGLDANTITMSQAAEILGVTTKTIRNWEEKGKIETVRTPGGHRRIPLTEIDRLQRKEVSYQEEDDTIMAPPTVESSPVLTPSEYEQFLKSFGLDSVDCLQMDKSDIELLPEVGLGAHVNRDHTSVLIRQVAHKIEDLLNGRLTDAEFLRISNIVSAVHKRGLDASLPAKKANRPYRASGPTPGVPDRPESTVGYLQG